MSHLAAGSSFPKHVGMKGEESSWSYPPSLSSALATPSSTAPTNTQLLAASICCDPAPLVHTQRGALLMIPTADRWSRDFLMTLAMISPARWQSSFTSQSQWLPTWNSVGNEWRSAHAGAERAPVKAWAGSGRLSQPALGRNPTAPMCMTAPRRCAEAGKVRQTRTCWPPWSPKCVF